MQAKMAKKYKLYPMLIYKLTTFNYTNVPATVLHKHHMYILNRFPCSDCI